MATACLLGKQNDTLRCEIDCALFRRERALAYALRRSAACVDHVNARNVCNPKVGRRVATRTARKPPPRYTVPDTLVSQSDEAPQASGDRSAAARILARSFYRELRENGYTPRQLLSLSTELIELVTQDLQRERQEGVSARVA